MGKDISWRAFAYAGQKHVTRTNLAYISHTDLSIGAFECHGGTLSKGKAVYDARTYGHDGIYNGGSRKYGTEPQL